MASGRNIAPDEAFEAAYSYAIPEEFRRQWLRRFGFQGINHQHVSESMAQRWRQQGWDPSGLRLISAYLGARSSLASTQPWASHPWEVCCWN